MNNEQTKAYNSQLIKELRSEYKDIKIRVSSMHDFILDIDFEKQVPDPEEQSLILEKFHSMRDYLNNLRRRIMFYERQQSMPVNEQHHCGQDVTCQVDGGSADVEELYGRIVFKPGQCDKCQLDTIPEYACKKILVPGIGHLCLIKNPMEWHDIKTEGNPKEFGQYYVHQLWPNGHQFVFVAQYSVADGKWRPWNDIYVVGVPLDDTQVEMITHWMPVGLPVINKTNKPNKE